jgi:hypothetical protein
MDTFKIFKTTIENQFSNLIKYDKLFVTDIEKDVLWDTYLNSYPNGSNNIYKERREFDCVACRSFIRKCGNVVAIKDNKLVSIWDINIGNPFSDVAEKMSKLVKSAKIKNIFVSNEAKLGVDKNNQMLEDGNVITWDHLYFELPRDFVNRSSDSIESIQGKFRDSKNVFKRSLDELTLDAGHTILELIAQGSIYRGEEHKSAISEFIATKTKYDKLREEDKDNWCWIKSNSSSITRIRNTALGTLLIDISEDVDLNVAVKKFDKVMAPTNYKRPKAIFTKKMVEDAQNKISELGYTNSLGRRFANLSDITVNNVLFLNRGVEKVNKSVFDDLKDEATVNPKNFSKVEDVNIEDFVNNILPSAKGIELMVESKHQSNLMSLIAPQDKDAPSMLKWNNNFSWSYNGDITDSMKQNVKNAGGNVEGVLRFSIQWNENADNRNDFDAHCIEPDRNKIYFSNKGRVHSSSGMLDVDIQNPGSKVAVENITWTNKAKMQEGRYKFLVHNYSHNGGRSGFTAEIEYDGQIYSYDYSKELKQGEKVIVAEIMFSKKDGIKFIKSLDSTASSKEIWGIKTNNFVKVSSLMFSPNYWDNQNGKGNKHYFFFLEGCNSDSLPRGFYNEFLKDDLLKHKRVFEALGSKMRVEQSDNQLSGLGFSSTQRNSIVAKVDGNFSRVIKINI